MTELEFGMDQDASAARFMDVVSKIDERREEMLDFLSGFVQQPSITGNEKVAAEWLEQRFNEFGLETERYYVPDVFIEEHPAFAHETNLPERPSIITVVHTSGSRNAKRLVINGHIDVVPPDSPSEWVHPPFSGARDGGFVHGRGTVDMKAGLVAGIFAALAIRDSGPDLPFDIEIQCVIGEESGGVGTAALAPSRPLPIGALVLEPSESRIMSALGGTQPFTLEVEGVPAHVGRPWEGVDAFDKLLLFVHAFRELEAVRQKTLRHPLFDEHPRSAPFSIGLVQAGEWRLTTPANAMFSGRLGTMPWETIEDIRLEIQSTVSKVVENDEWLSQHPPRITWDGAGFQGWETEESSDLVQVAKAAARTLGGPLELLGRSAGSDASTFAKLGVPVLQFGPGEGAHEVNESVAEDEVLYICKLVALTLLGLSQR